jgi:hypothetical protein
MSHQTHTFQFFTQNIDVHRAIGPALQARIDLAVDAAEVITELEQIKQAVDQVIYDHDNPPVDPGPGVP